MIFIGSGVSWGAPVWKELSSKADQFSVSMPGDPQFKSAKIEKNYGSIEAHQWVVETEDGTGFVALANEYPSSYVEKVDPQVILDEVQKAALGSKGQLRREKKIQVGGYPGRETVIEIFERVIYSRRILVKSRLYQLVVAMKPANERALSNDIKKYFDSFKLLKN
jgi:hypothetical protein